MLRSLFIGSLQHGIAAVWEILPDGTKREVFRPPPQKDTVSSIRLCNQWIAQQLAGQKTGTTK
jgi:hypothetical protein